MDTPLDDDGARALTRLPIQYRDKPRMRGFVTALAKEAQELDAGLYTLWTGRQLATAVGGMLDVYGELVGEERLGREDAAYRIAIRARMVINRGSGTPTELTRLLRLLAPEPLAISLAERFPAGVTLSVSNGALFLPTAVHAALQSAKPAGVGLRLHYQDGPDAERFVTASGVGLGFAGLPADYVGPRVDVRPTGVLLGPVVDESGSGGLPPVVTLVGDVPDTLVGIVSMEVVDPSPDYTFSWYDDGAAGYGNYSYQGMFPGGVEVPVELVDENVVVGPVGIAVQWTEGDPYGSGDVFSFAVSHPASTPPTLADAGTLAFTGRVLVEVVQGAPGYTFRYTLGSQPARTTAMLRGTAVPLLLADGVTPSGLTVTWPNVTTHYPEAKWAWRVVAADATVGGRFVGVLGG